MNCLVSRVASIVLFALLLGMSSVQAQDNSSQQATDAAGGALNDETTTVIPPQRSDDADDANGNAENADEESNSRFIPTEEISQDFGVSFPVDI